MTFKTEIPFSELSKQIREITASLDRDRLQERRWFRKKSDLITGMELLDYGVFEIPDPDLLVIPLLLLVKLQDTVRGDHYQELYYLPLLISRKQEQPAEVLLEISHPDYRATASDGVHTPAYNRALTGLLAGTGQFLMKEGRIITGTLSGFKGGRFSTSRPLTDLSSNSLTLLSEDLIIKTYRRLKEGVNPDLELSLNLLQETGFRSFAQPRGYVYYNSFRGERYYLCLIEDYVKNQGDAWKYTREHLSSYLVNAAGLPGSVAEAMGSETGGMQPEADQVFQAEMRGIGRVIAELHLALAGIDKEGFRPAAPRLEELDEWYKGVVGDARLVFRKIKLQQDSELAPLLEEIIPMEGAVYQAVERIYELQNHLGKVFRVHGDLHLEQILKTGDGYLILDFEGEPLKSLEERRLKQSPLKDLAGMIRSYNYAAHTALFDFYRENPGMSKLEVDYYQKAVRIWEREAIDAFLAGYRSKIRKERPELLPAAGVFSEALALFKLEKALYEAVYEINNRPEWLSIPLKGIKDCLGDL